MAASFECSVCLRLMHQPATLPCGHSFCRACLQQCFQHSLKCSACRADVPAEASHPQVNIALSDALELLHPQETAARRAEAAAEPVDDAPGGLASFPLFVLEPLLPGQVMTLHVFEPRYIRLTERALSEARLEKCFGMVCASPRSTGLAVHGVEAKILEHSPAGGGRYFVRVQGRRRFRILRTWDMDGYRNAAIAWAADGPPALDAAGSSAPAPLRGSPASSVDSARRGAAAEVAAEEGPGFGSVAEFHGVLLAAELRAELTQWLVEVRCGWERRDGQVDRLLADLGPMPTADQLAAMGMYAAAAINPLPPLGVAPEIRLAALEATEPLSRLRLVLAATETSLHHMRARSHMNALGWVWSLVAATGSPWRATALIFGAIALGVALLQERVLPALAATLAAHAHPFANAGSDQVPYFGPSRDLSRNLAGWFDPLLDAAARVLASAQALINSFGFL